MIRVNLFYLLHYCTRSIFTAIMQEISLFIQYNIRQMYMMFLHICPQFTGSIILNIFLHLGYPYAGTHHTLLICLLKQKKNQLDQQKKIALLLIVAAKKLESVGRVFSLIFFLNFETQMKLTFDKENNYRVSDISWLYTQFILL